MKTKHQIIIIIILTLIFTVECVFYVRGVKQNNNGTSNVQMMGEGMTHLDANGDIGGDTASSNSSMGGSNSDKSSSNSDITSASSNSSSSSSTQKKTNIINTETQVLSASTENIELHTTYYLQECFVEENQEVKAGDNILEYTNGTYLTAPYDCVIISLNLPSTSGKCTSSHYVEISASNLMEVELIVDETIVSNLTVGEEATITVPACDNKNITGYITKISNTASNGQFTVYVQFNNDGDVKIGMTAEVNI